VKARTADRLTTRSFGDGRRARWALWRLLRAGDRGDTRATDALWGRWILDGNDEIGAALTRWRRPHTGGGPSLVALGGPVDAAVVIESVRRTGHPIANLARSRILAGQQDLVDAACEAALTDEALAAFCVEHHLAPADPHRAAAFFLLTGQRDQYRLADPDYSLLAVTYRGGREDERRRIRAWVAGEPDLVRVLAESNRKDRMTRLSTSEGEYLTGQLAERRDWPALWALTQDLPVRQAIDAARLIDGWSPEPADEVVFHALTHADPASIARARAALVLPSSTRITVPGTPVDGAFSPDGTRFAVAHDDGVDVYALPSWRHETRNSRRDNGIRAVLALDDAVIMTAGIWGASWGMGFLDRGGGGRPLTRKIIPGGIVALAHRPGGYAALTVSEGNIRLRLQDDDGRQGPLPVPRIVPVEVGKPGSPEEWALASDPAGDRIAVAGDAVRILSVSDATVHIESTMTEFAPGRYPAVLFTGQDRLLTLDGAGTLRLWHRTDGRIVAERQLTPRTGRPALVDVPGADAFAVLDNPPAEPMRLLNRETLADVTAQRQFDGTPATCAFGLPGTSLLAVGGRRHVDLVDLGSAVMAALVDRPLATTGPADLRAVAKHLARTPPDSAARPVLELLRACLEHRFGAEVALGQAGSPNARADDIALGSAR
jgi:hypothetical protein